MAEGDTDPTQAFQSRLAKMNGDAMAFATTLFDENFQHRQKIRELEGKVPADGSVVLSKADATRWEEFKALGKKPDELKQALKSSEDLTGEIATLKRKDVLRDVAEVGFADSKLKLSVLEDLDGKAEGIEYKIKEEKDKAGNTRKVVYVVSEGKESPLETFAAEKWADYVPALKLEQGQTTTKTGMTGDPAPRGNQTTLERIRNQEKERQAKAQPTGGLSLKERFLGRRAPAA